MQGLMNSQAHLPNTGDEDSADHQVSPSSSIEDLAEKIRALHVEGTSLPAERVLAERLGVARYTLRRALQHLREQGSIPAARPRSRGRSIKTRHEDLVSVTNPLEVAELRRIIEPIFAKLAALRATPSDIAAMQRELEKGGRGNGPDLHRIIAQATGNTLAAEIYSLLRQIEGDTRMGISAERAQAGESLERQRAVVEAIAARSPDRASEAMNNTLSEIYRQSLYDFG